MQEIAGLTVNGKKSTFLYVNPKVMQERYDYYKENPGYDCSEIAEDLYNVTN